MRLFRLIIVWTALLGAARADDENQTRARAHFEIGNGMYRLGDYSGALREFAAGYELTKKPGFLINLGQTYRKLHDLARAKEMYQRYLAVTPPDDPARAQVQLLLADIETELRAQPPAAPEPIPSPGPALTPAAATTLSTSATPTAPRRRNRAMIASGAVLGILGVGLLAGGGAAASLADGLAQELNDLDARRGTFDSAKDDQYHLDRSLEASLLGIGAAIAVTGIVLVAVGAR
jgi:tetratricopeptide (TPR) repeat protein